MYEVIKLTENEIIYLGTFKCVWQAARVTLFHSLLLKFAPPPSISYGNKVHEDQTLKGVLKWPKSLFGNSCKIG